jgi:penicillin-binding protein 2A
MQLKLKSKYIIRIAIALISAVVVFTLAFAAAVQLTPFDAKKLIATSLPTVIYDKTGAAYMTVAEPGAPNLPYQDIPKNLQNALVATEDHGFWHSSSIDIEGILRAAFVDLWSHSFAQGASTIQEQLAKIVYLNDKKTIVRKLRQVVLGVQINRHFTKQEILTMYLNRVYLGERSVGVEQAAMRYFGIDLSKHQRLTLAQAALLAGLPQAPTAYDPINHPQAAKIRRNEVLENMARYGYITAKQAVTAERQPIQVSFHKLPGNVWDNHPLLANFLFAYAKRQGISQEQLMQGGLKIYTTIDPAVQGAIHKVFWANNYNGEFPGAATGTTVHGSALFIDPKTGGILGAAGSRKQGFTPFGPDRIYSDHRSPGSSIMPIIAYAPAIQSGKFGPGTLLNNTPHNFGKGYIPHNDKTHTPPTCTLSYALATSQHVASIDLLHRIGINQGANFAVNDGLPVSASDRKHLGIVLGDLQKGVTPFEMARAYEAFADNGVQMQPYLISKIMNPEGVTTYRFHSAAKRIMSPHTAGVMTQLLQNVVSFGTGVRAEVQGWSVAGKTGTAQYSSNQSGEHPHWISSAWFDGYTPNMVGSLYLGCDKTRVEQAMTNTSHTLSGDAAALFGSIIGLAEHGKIPETFDAAQTGNSTQEGNSAGANNVGHP